MKGERDRVIRIVWTIIAVAVLTFALVNNLWAEPLPQEPPKITPILMVEAYSTGAEVEETVEVIEMEESDEIDELMLLACCVEAEAGNQSKIGKRLVADVVLNRVSSPDFPNSIPEVITQSNQFAVVGNGAIDTVIPSAETWEAVYKELDNRIDEEILFFQTDSFSPYGADAYRVDDHYFSRAIQ